MGHHSQRHITGEVSGTSLTTSHHGRIEWDITHGITSRENRMGHDSRRHITRELNGTSLTASHHRRIEWNITHGVTSQEN